MSVQSLSRYHESLFFVALFQVDIAKLQVGSGLTGLYFDCVLQITYGHLLHIQFVTDSCSLNNSLIVFGFLAKVLRKKVFCLLCLPYFL